MMPNRTHPRPLSHNPTRSLHANYRSGCRCAPCRTWSSIRSLRYYGGADAVRRRAQPDWTPDPADPPLLLLDGPLAGLELADHRIGIIGVIYAAGEAHTYASDRMAVLPDGRTTIGFTHLRTEAQ